MDKTVVIEGVGYITEEIKGKGLCLVPKLMPIPLYKIDRGTKLKLKTSISAKYTVITEGGSGEFIKWAVLLTESSDSSLIFGIYRGSISETKKEFVDFLNDKRFELE